MNEEPNIHQQKIAVKKDRIILNVLFHTSEYRGDHSADIAIALPVTPTDTMETLVALAEATGNIKPGDWFEIRIIKSL